MSTKALLAESKAHAHDDLYSNVLRFECAAQKGDRERVMCAEQLTRVGSDGKWTVFKFPLGVDVMKPTVWLESEDGSVPTWTEAELVSSHFGVMDRVDSEYAHMRSLMYPRLRPKPGYAPVPFSDSNPLTLHTVEVRIKGVEEGVTAWADCTGIDMSVRQRFVWTLRGAYGPYMVRHLVSQTGTSANKVVTFDLTKLPMHVTELAWIVHPADGSPHPPDEHLVDRATITLGTSVVVSKPSDYFCTTHPHRRGMCPLQPGMYVCTLCEDPERYTRTAGCFFVQGSKLELALRPGAGEVNVTMYATCPVDRVIPYVPPPQKSWCCVS